MAVCTAVSSRSTKTGFLENKTLKSRPVLVFLQLRSSHLRGTKLEPVYMNSPVPASGCQGPAPTVSPYNAPSPCNKASTEVLPYCKDGISTFGWVSPRSKAYLPTPMLLPPCPSPKILCGGGKALETQIIPESRQPGGGELLPSTPPRLWVTLSVH